MQPNKNPYDFITNSEPPKKTLNFGGGSTKTRVIQVAIFAIVIFIVLMVLYSLVFGNKKSTADLLYKPAAQQADLIELSKIGSEKVREGKANLKMTTAYALLSSQNADTLAIIKKSGGGKSSTKTIVALQDKKYEEVLKEAESNGKYEETFLALYANRLDAYKTSLESVYSQTSGKNKDAIGEMYSDLQYISLTEQTDAPKQ